MPKPKYSIGDRFTVMNTVECKIIWISKAKNQIRYVFQLFDNPVFQSTVTQEQLDDILASQQNPPDETRPELAIETSI